MFLKFFTTARFIFMLMFFPHRCQACFSKEIRERNHSYLDGPWSQVMEFDQYCSKCGYSHNYWVTGNYHIPRDASYFDRCEWVEHYIETLEL